MKNKKIAWIMASVLCLTAPIGAQAPASSGHSGVHAAIGAGYGSIAFTCDVCGDTRESSVALMLRLGGAVRPDLVLSGEVTGWSNGFSFGTESVTWINLVAQYYPERTGGFFLKGGVGVAAISSNTIPNGAGYLQFDTKSVGGVIGIGFDARLSKSFSLTPYIDLLYATPAHGDANVNGGRSGTTLGANMVQLGLAASYR